MFDLKKIQELPPTTKTRILLVSALLIAIGLITIFYQSVGNAAKNFSTSDIEISLSNDPKSTENSGPKYIKAEWIERKDNQLYVYFKVSNNTNSILNFSKPEHVTLTYDNKSFNAQQLNDRQDRSYFVKILSQTESYGVAVFENINVDKAKLKFDQLFFENQIGTIFYEEMELDLNKLNKSMENRP